MSTWMCLADADIFMKLEGNFFIFYHKKNRVTQNPYLTDNMIKKILCIKAQQ